MNKRKVLPLAVVAVMLASVLGVVFSPVSDDAEIPTTDNLLQVGDAVGIGGNMSYEDMIRIFALDGGEDYKIDDERIEKFLTLGEPLLVQTAPDLNGDSTISVSEEIALTQYNTFAVIEFLEEELGMDVSGSASLYGMMELIQEKDGDYVAKVDAAAQMSISIAMSIGERPFEGTYSMDDLEQITVALFLYLFPDISETAKNEIAEDNGGFLPSLLEEEEVWANLSLTMAFTVGGYMYMTKTDDSDFEVSAYILDMKAGMDLNLSSNAKIAITLIDGDPGIMISYPGETQTYGIRVNVSASMEVVFSETSADSIKPRIGVATDIDGKTWISYSDPGCLVYQHMSMTASAETYGNAVGGFTMLMGTLPAVFSTGNGYTISEASVSFHDSSDSSETPDYFDIGVEEDRVEMDYDGGVVVYMEYDAEAGEYTIFFDDSTMTYPVADKTAPTVFGLLIGGSVILDGEGKSTISGAVNSVRNKIPGELDSVSKVIFLGQDGKKLSQMTITNGKKIPASSFPQFNLDGKVVVGWRPWTMSGQLGDLVTESAVITHDLMLIPVIADDKTDDPGYLGFESDGAVYQRIDDVDYAFGSGVELNGERYVDYYEDGALVCKWYFDFWDPYDAENLKLKVESIELPPEATEVFGDRKMVLLSFAGSGTMPDEAQVSYPVGNDFGNGLFAVYEVVGDDIVLRSYGRASEGMATFNVNHLSEYLIVKSDVDPAASNTGTIEGPADSTMLYIGVGGVAVVAVIAGTIFFMRRP